MQAIEHVLRVAVVAFGFVVSTIAGFLLSVNVGLLGFQDHWSAQSATIAFGVELAALVVLAAGAALFLRVPGTHPAVAGRAAGHAGAKAGGRFLRVADHPPRAASR